MYVTVLPCRSDKLHALIHAMSAWGEASVVSTVVKWGTHSRITKYFSTMLS